MALETRYAVRKDERSSNRRYWWHTKPREDFIEGWEGRHLFTRVAEALAVIWKGRAQDYSNSYRFVLVKVTRKFESANMTKTPNAPVQQEARVP